MRAPGPQLWRHHSRYRPTFQRWTTMASFLTRNCCSSCSQHFQLQQQKRNECSRKWRKLQQQFVQQWKRTRHGWVHMFITHRPTLTLQLHNFDLFRTCRTSSFCTVAWQLARFQLTRRIARSFGDSWACCTFTPHVSYVINVSTLRGKTPSLTHSAETFIVRHTKTRKWYLFTQIKQKPLNFRLFMDEPSSTRGMIAWEIRLSQQTLAAIMPFLSKVIARTHTDALTTDRLLYATVAWSLLFMITTVKEWLGLHNI